MIQAVVSYKRHRFPPAVIAHAVWLYFRFPLSLRLVEEMLLERGIVVSYETIRCWVKKFGPDYAGRLLRKAPSSSDSWHLDEVVVMIGGRRHWLWRAVDQDGYVHTGIVYRVSGRMAPTGTAWDRAILVPIRAVWQLHGMEGRDGHDQPGEAAANASANDHDAHGHEAHIDADAPIDEHFDAGTPGIPAVLVKPKTIADAYRLRQEYRGETTLAVFPAEVLTRLYATLGDARSLLLAIAIGTQFIVVAAILLVTIMHIGARRQQIGALRAFGAPRRSIVAIVWGELLLLFLAGFGLGILFGYGAARLISASLVATTAIRMPVEFARDDISLAVWFVALAALVSVVPALSALRLSPARALRA